MLTIRYTKYRENCDIPTPDIYFNNTYEYDWLEDQFIKDMIKDVDKSILENGIVKSPVLGYIPIEKISGGIKAVILMYKMPDKVVNATACGDNCAKWILEVGYKQNITIRLGHLMKFPDVTFKEPVFLEDSGEYCKDWGELLDKSLELDFFNEEPDYE